ncbi:hypothetical protein D9619_007927 [Psilocybe cf. subviscida]|uniref:Uncharacterized protein n=1 Tax=Psilocybe cf. subviscida TaxID=2480587 RepID=A0A8H5AU83_9AGAR|nr:hypothetical protein D9619_007927 [Psilocybe cf. subviscida]
MAGAFSGHLIDQYNPNSPYNSSIVSHGAMSFNPNMHGTPQAQQAFSLFGTQATFGMAYDTISEETQRKIATLQVKLNQKLGPEFISQRPGPGGGPKLTYVEGWKIINLANEVFGFNGWSSSIVSLTTDFMDYNEESRKYNAGVTALIRVTLRDGVFHEDIGYGMLENSRSKGAALDKCKKEAVTDGLKRALRNFGNVMGNCLYDKSYAQEIVKIKFEPTKLNKDSLHRRPEFEDVKPAIPTATTTKTSNAAASSSTSRPNYTNNHNTSMNTSMSTSMNTSMNTSINTSSSRPMQQASSIPPHMQNIQHDSKGKAPAHHANGPPAQRPPAPNHHQNNQNAPAPAAGQSRPPVSAPAPAPPKPNPLPAQKPNSALEASDSQSHFFDSDDDAFLATVDLGPAFSAEADMGRPIMVDADMGQPINHEEGLMRGPDEYDDEDDEEHMAEEVKPVPVLKSSSSGAKSRHELIAAALSGSNDGNASMTSVAGAAAGGATSKPPSGQGGGGGGAWSSITSGSSSSGIGMGSRQPPNPKGSGQPRATSLAQQNHQRYMAQRQQNNQNHNPAQNNSSSTSSTSALATSASGEAGKRSSANSTMQSSVGGFNFPPGMNPLASSNNANIPNFSAAGSGSGIGTKRPADAMGSSYTMSGRPGINLPPQAGANRGGGGVGGMSGFNGNGITNGSGRSVLGALDITEGGDVKRRRS